MDELDEFMEQEACDTMDTVTVFDLPCGSLMRYCKLDAEEDTQSIIIRVCGIKKEPCYSQ